MNCRDEPHHQYICKAGILRKSPVKRTPVGVPGILVQENKYFIARALVGQWEYHDLEQRVLWRADEQKPDAILIEETGFGTALISTLKQRKVAVIAVKPEGDKKARLLRQISKFTNRQIFLLKNAPGRSELEDRTVQFPRWPAQRSSRRSHASVRAQALTCLWTEESVKNYGNLLASLALRGVRF